ncbi:Vegetative incompatibility protein HET-E-1, partial [Pseudocercospora fuligena]
ASMRLINVHTLELEQFSDQACPPYGILSNTWEAEEELIAPTNVNFHSADWDLIGSLNDEPETNELISEYTGIAYSVLAKETTPSQWCIATRMSWASQRTTTRIEDEAYCLLGIFDVSLPLIYGEGRRAFIRLQEEIIRRTSDHSILAWNRIIEGQSECNDLLAASPANFKNALEDEIMQWSESYEISQPYSMTSLGLRMALPLVPCMPADDDGLSLSNNGKFFHAVLNCRLRSADRSLLTQSLLASEIALEMRTLFSFSRCHRSNYLNRYVL